MKPEQEKAMLFAYHYSGERGRCKDFVPNKMTMTEKLHGVKPAKVFHTNEVKR